MFWLCSAPGPDFVPIPNLPVAGLYVIESAGKVGQLLPGQLGEEYTITVAVILVLRAADYLALKGHSRVVVQLKAQKNHLLLGVDILALYTGAAYAEIHQETLLGPGKALVVLSEDRSRAVYGQTEVLAQVRCILNHHVRDLHNYTAALHNSGL